jgi:hypothetical protein
LLASGLFLLPRSRSNVLTCPRFAIHYEYTLSSDVNPSAVTKQGIRNTILPTLCSTASTRRIRDSDIAMRYSYAFTGSTKTIEITFTKADC